MMNWVAASLPLLRPVLVVPSSHIGWGGILMQVLQNQQSQQQD
jgi:hypothetical protein